MKKLLLLFFLQFSIAFAANQAVKKIFLVGDSTVMSYNTNAYPMTGWGQVLQKFIDNTSFTIDNRAIGGRSSRSFIEEGRWTTVKNTLVAGDFVMIQFGHNDRDFSKAERYTPPADYKVYLQQYVNESRALGAIPILVTPMVLNAWRNGVKRNVFTESGAEYVQKMKEVANELRVPLIDLNQKSFDFVNTIGVDYATRFIYNTYLAGEYPNYPDGLSDGTHFQEMGALQMTKFIVEGLQALSGHADVGLISNALLAQYPVTVTSNVAGAGTITRSDSYPLGATVTLKALVNSGHTFLYWKNVITNTVVTTDNMCFFTMGTSAVSYQAIFDSDVSTDCAGVPGGNAKIDNCGVCSGGNSGIMACTGELQGEAVCDIDGVLLEVTNTGFLGEGYANTTNVLGARLSFDIQSTTSKSVGLYIRYANGGTTSRDAQVFVNNTSATTLLLPSSGSWTIWKTAIINVSLQAGANEIVFEANTADGLANVDVITWSDVDVFFSQCPLETGLDNTGDYHLKSYPNPFSDTFILTVPTESSYQIFNSKGVNVLSGMCEGECEIGLELTTGIYQLVIVTDGIKATQKIMKK